MNIDKLKRQHVEILSGINELRQLVHAGTSKNARAIANKLVELSSTVRLHLAVEDRVLYPGVEATSDENLKRMSRAYQSEMDGLARAYLDFVSKWNTGAQVSNDPDGFRAGANIILRQVFDRMQRENREFYPSVEAAAVPR